MTKINQGQVKMKSRLNILAGELGLGSGVVLSSFILMFVLAGLIYWLRANQDLLSFSGPYRGIRLFLQTFPYLWLMVFIALFVFLSWLLKKYDFSYKKPLIIILSVIVALVGILSLFLQQHPVLANYLRHRLPLIYAPINAEPGYIVGEVISQTGNELRLNTQNNNQYLVQYDKDTQFPRSTVMVGDTVRVIGIMNKQTIKARAVMNLSKQKQLYRITPLAPGKGKRFGR